jgi:hypothetical protein
VPRRVHRTLEQKGSGKPDGCALFFRAGVFATLDIARVEYVDGPAGQAHSAHRAQLVMLQHAHRTLGIAHTHLKWDQRGHAGPAGMPPLDRLG